MPLALLDLNDTIIGSNRPDGFVFHGDDYFFLDGALDAVRLWGEEGWAMAIVSNQPAHHRFPEQVTENDMRALMGDMADLIHELTGYGIGCHICYHDGKRCEACGGSGFTMAADTFDQDTYRCPTCGGLGTVGCDCRKPRPGLLLRAMADAEVSPGDAVMVGDKWSDMMAASLAGVPGILIGTFGYEGRGRTTMPVGVPPPMMWLPDLWQAAVMTVARARMGDPRA